MVKTLACCAGGGEPKIFQGPSSEKSQLDVIQWNVKLAAPCTSVCAGQVKDPTHGVNV